VKFESGLTYVASLAPSFPACFDCHPLQLVTALKQAGFAYVEETVVVLPEILKLRQHYLKEMDRPLLGESCPKVLQMIVDDYPHLARHVPPVPSPMALHGQRLKERYGQDCRTVFFSPCIYKKLENDQKKAMDQVMTFVELQALLTRKINGPLHLLDKTDFDSKIAEKAARLGVLAMNVHGAAACSQFLQRFTTIQPPPYSEVLYCQGGCAQTAGGESAVARILETWEDYA
jgi:iron only hydrogenase large subunit-like protein